MISWFKMKSLEWKLNSEKMQLELDKNSLEKEKIKKIKDKLKIKEEIISVKRAEIQKLLSESQKSETVTVRIKDTVLADLSCYLESEVEEKVKEVGQKLAEANGYSNFLCLVVTEGNGRSRYIPSSSSSIIFKDPIKENYNEKINKILEEISLLENDQRIESNQVITID